MSVRLLTESICLSCLWDELSAMEEDIDFSFLLHEAFKKRIETKVEGQEYGL